MKVVFNCFVPFMLAHGGAQVQIEQTMLALRELGISVEPLRWWDPEQKADVLHHFGRIPPHLIELAHNLGIKVVMSPFMSGTGARPYWMRLAQRIVVGAGRRLAPKPLRHAYGWDSYQLVDACVAMTPFERSLMTGIFGAPLSRVEVIPNGVEHVFFDTAPVSRGKWLICTATIIELKQVLKLAQIAVQANTPLWVIGKPYGEDDGYAKRFVQFAKANSGIIRFEGPITDRPRLALAYREARGFVLLSRWESLSLSALEAAASGCPLLLSDLPWARETFKAQAMYCPHDADVATSAAIVRRFYDEAPHSPAPPRPMSWIDVAGKLKALYAAVIARGGEVSHTA